MLWGESKRRVALKIDQKEGTKTCAQIQAIYSLQQPATPLECQWHASLAHQSLVPLLLAQLPHF